MGESENIELIVEPSLSGMRLDAYLRGQTPFSRSRYLRPAPTHLTYPRRAALSESISP